MNKTGVIVVHGIGDPQPGATLETLTDTLAGGDAPLIEALSPTIARSVEKADAKRPELVRHVPMATRSAVATGHGQQLLFAEVYWGGVGRLAGGTVGVLQGLLRLFFSIPNLVEGAIPRQLMSDASATGETLPLKVRLVRAYTGLFWRFALVTSMLLSGPVLALNLIMGGGYAGYEILETFGNNGAWFTCLLVSAISVIVGIWLLRTKTRCARLDEHYPQFDTRVHDHVARTLRSYKPIEVFAWSLITLAALWVLTYAWLMKIEPAVAAEWLRSYDREGDDPWFALGAILALAMRWLFGIILSLLAVTIGLFAAADVAVCIGKRMGKRQGTTAQRLLYRRELSIAALGVTLQYLLWVMLAPALWLFLLSKNSKQDAFSETLYDIAVFGDGLQWIGATILLIALPIAWTQFNLAAKRWDLNNKDYYNTARQPRLTVHPWLRITLLGMVFIGAVSLLITEFYAPQSDVIQPFVDDVVSWLKNAGFTNLAAAGMMFAAAAVLTALRTGLDLANDVLGYLFWNSAPQRAGERVQRQALASTQKQSTGNAAADFDDLLAYARPVRSGFRAVLDHLIKNEGVDHLVVIAHSQGTVIALDELSHDANRHPHVNVTFVTMGSPISHLYQYYFPASYPPDWQHPQWSNLFTRVRRWINVFRADDFVGTTIQEIERDDFDFTQVRVGLGGHGHYWSDKRVRAALHNQDIFRPHQEKQSKNKRRVTRAQSTAASASAQKNEDSVLVG